MATVCEAPMDLTGMPAVIVSCGEPAAGTVTFACVHEHITRSGVCFDCACDLQQCAGELTCPDCYDGDPSADCYQAVTITWGDGTITRVQGIDGRNLL